VRLSSPAWAAFLFLVACYQQPALSPQSPLRCDRAVAEGECPSGYTCSVLSVCAPESCRADSECPVGLGCVSRVCAPAVDGGTRDGGAGDLLIPPIGFDGSAIGFDGPVTDPPDGATLPDSVVSGPDGGQD
jgi:hypothetical protein